MRAHARTHHDRSAAIHAVASSILDAGAATHDASRMTGPDPFPPSDPLGEALHHLRMDGAFYCRSELTAPWGLTLPPMPGYAWFHVVTQGGGLLEAAPAVACDLRPGELALVPHGEGHTLRSEPGVSAPGVLELDREWVSDRYELLRAGGGGRPTTLICGAVRLGHPAARELMAMLPPLMHLAPSGGPGTDWLRATLALIAQEARAMRPGGEAVVTRLGDILVIQAIRVWLDRDPGARTGWLGALRDPQIGRALALVHREPGRDWTVASMAAHAAMSRSAFAARFTALVGEPAVRHLTRRRMYAAHTALEEEGATVAQVASRLGYRSEAAFARAFKRVVGVSPGAVRRSGGLAVPSADVTTGSARGRTRDPSGGRVPLLEAAVAVRADRDNR